jgi:hypothetical protein
VVEVVVLSTVSVVSVVIVAVTAVADVCTSDEIALGALFQTSTAEVVAASSTPSTGQRCWSGFFTPKSGPLVTFSIASCSAARASSVLSCPIRRKTFEGLS